MASPDQRDPSAPFRFDLFLDLAINFYAAPELESATHIESPKTKGQTRLNDGFFNFQESLSILSDFPPFPVTVPAVATLPLCVFFLFSCANPSPVRSSHD